MARVNKRYNTDVIVAKTFAAMVSDLSVNASLNSPRYDAVRDVVAKACLSDDYRELRRLSIDMPEPNFQGNAYEFKATYQIKNFLKRYVFGTDLYTNDDLEVITNSQFLKLQEELSLPRGPFRLSTELVIQRARSIVKRVLGPYDENEHAVSCRFSTKACVGFPTPKSYLHTKMDGPLTGSYGHLRWFAEHRTSDNLLDAAASKDLLEIDALALFNVPKSFKILRGITPNSLIGSYHSYGLGKMFERRLKNVGIDISRQPEKHKQIAQRESVRMKYVTTDLTSASHCFTSVTVRKLVPYEWYRHINLGRISTILIDEKPYYMASFMAMGIGFTFPLQTLLFYAIIKAVQELLGKNGLISVFGDDLIYSRQIHPAVVSVLTDLGFKINKDKTFVSVPFRESCGGDFFKSVDVRPACPQGRRADLGKWRYLAFLHKLANSLTLRWTEYELGSTLHLLKREIVNVHGSLMVIPDDLPDYAGLKRVTRQIMEGTVKPSYDRHLHAYVFACLVEQPDKILVPTLISYFWDALRSKGCGEDLQPPSVWNTVRDSISWVKPGVLGEKSPKNYRSRVTRRRLEFLLPATTVKGGRGAILRVRQAISILAS